MNVLQHTVHWVFVRWKANFLCCQGANKNQTHTVTFHQAAGLSAREGRRETERETGGVTETARRERERECHRASSGGLPFPLPQHINKVGKESLYIGLINSYSSSAWHPGNRSWFALGLIFRPVEDSQSIRALYRLHTTNFRTSARSKVRKEKMREWLKREWMTRRERWSGIRCRESGWERKGERGWAAGLAVIYDV